MAFTGAYTEEFRTCPYDSSHKILRHRFATHLVKCKKNHPNSSLVACKFNQTHVVPSSELREHMDNCPDREHTETFINALKSKLELTRGGPGLAVTGLNETCFSV